jgi:hypothetical protein
MNRQDRIIRVISASNGRPTPHDGRYVLHWNPHTEFGVLELVSVSDPALARRFSLGEIVAQRRTISRVQSRRPDGAPNRPLLAITVVVERI